MAHPKQPLKDLIDEKNQLTREQLQANVQISHNWKTAVASGEYKGAVSLHIATLLDFLEKEHVKAVAAYEAAFPAQPQFGRPPAPAPKKAMTCACPRTAPAPAGAECLACGGAIPETAGAAA